MPNGSAAGAKYALSSRLWQARLLAMIPLPVVAGEKMQPTTVKGIDRIRAGS